MSGGSEGSTALLASVCSVFQIWDQKIDQLYLDLTILREFLRERGYGKALGQVLNQGRENPEMIRLASESYKAWREPLEKAKGDAFFEAFSEVFAQHKTN